MKKLILLFALCFVAPALAQERPIAGTTLQSTDTTANSLLIGCAVGSTTCTGGLKAGALVIGGGTSITSSSNIALLNVANTFTALGTHLFSATGVGVNALQLRQATAGTGNFASLQVGNDTNGAIGAFASFSSTFTTAGNAFADGSLLQNNGAGGLSIAANAATGVIRFYTNGATERWRINAAGDLAFGTTPFIYLSAGTPTINSGFGVASGATITGTDNGFTVTLGTVASTAGVVTFGHTMSNVVCTANAETAALNASIALGSVSGSSISFAYTSSASLKIYVVCIGKP